MDDYSTCCSLLILLDRVWKYSSPLCSKQNPYYKRIFKLPMGRTISRRRMAGGRLPSHLLWEYWPQNCSLASSRMHLSPRLVHLQSWDAGCLGLDKGRLTLRFSCDNKSPSHTVGSNQRDPQQFSHLTGYFVYGPACSFRLKIAPIYFLLSVISLASFVLLKYFQLFGCPIVREVVVQFVLKGHFLKKNDKKDLSL